MICIWFSYDSRMMILSLKDMSRQAIIVPHCYPRCTHRNTCVHICSSVQISCCAMSTCVDKYASFRPVYRFACLLLARVSVCTYVDLHVHASWTNWGSSMLAFVSLRHLYSTCISCLWFQRSSPAQWKLRHQRALESDVLLLNPH